jgi:hypothetical protein
LRSRKYFFNHFGSSIFLPFLKRDFFSMGCCLERPAPGRSPAVLGRSPAVLGRSPAVLGRSPAVLGRSPAVPTLNPDKIMETFDTNKDGVLDSRELANLMQKITIRESGGR